MKKLIIRISEMLEKRREDKKEEIRVAIEKKDWDTVLSLTKWDTNYTIVRAHTKVARRLKKESATN